VCVTGGFEEVADAGDCGNDPEEPRYDDDDGVVVVRYIEEAEACKWGGIADIGVGAAVAGIGIICCCIAPALLPPCIVEEVWTAAGRGTGVEEGGVTVVVAFCCMLVGSNSANVF